MVLSDDTTNSVNFRVKDDEFSNELNVCRRCVSMNINSDDCQRLVLVNKLLASMIHKDLILIANEKGGPCVAFRDGKFGKATNAGPQVGLIDEFVTRSELERILDDRDKRKV